MINISQHEEIYNSIVKEFQLSVSISQELQIEIEDLVKNRIEISKLFKLPNVNAQTLGLNKQVLIKKIYINESCMNDYGKKQIELIDKINVNKQRLKVIKLDNNELANILLKEKMRNRKFREELRIFVGREKFKIIKKVFDPKYKKVFAKYSNDLNIKSQIEESNKRKEKMHEEKRKFDFSLEKCNRKITTDKITFSRIRKNIIIMRKQIEFFSMKIRALDDYIEMEKNFKMKLCNMKSKI